MEELLGDLFILALSAVWVSVELRELPVISCYVNIKAVVLPRNGLIMALCSSLTEWLVPVQHSESCTQVHLAQGRF